MDGSSGLMLFGAGLAGGIVTAVVGGASLLTFPALLAAGLPPIVANASRHHDWHGPHDDLRVALLARVTAP